MQHPTRLRRSHEEENDASAIAPPMPIRLGTNTSINPTTTNMERREIEEKDKDLSSSIPSIVGSGGDNNFTTNRTPPTPSSPSPSQLNDQEKPDPPTTTNIEGIDDEDYQCWLSKIKDDGSFLKDAPEKCRNDKKIVLTAVQNSYWAFQYASPDLQNDEEILYQYWLSKLKIWGRNLEDAPEKLRNDKKTVLTAVQHNGWALQFASPNMQNDKKIVLTAVQQCGVALQYASPDMQNDKKIVLTAVQKHGTALQYASPNMQNDKEIVLTAVKQNSGALKYSSPDLQNDKVVVMQAVKKYSGELLDCPLQFASQPLQDDRQVVLTACGNMGKALKFASPRLQNDLEVVMTAFQADLDSLEYAGDRISSRKKNMLKMCRLNGATLRDAPDWARADKDVVLAAVTSKPLVLKYALGGLNQDRDCLIAAGIWEKIYAGNDRKPQITLSTRFSQDPNSGSQATLFTILFKKNEYIRSNFSLYSPNAWAKCTCDPNWTDFHHPCRGTFDTCQFEDNLKTGEPKPDSCWRYSFRCQLEKSKRTNGFMLQILEAAPSKEENNHNGRKLLLGKANILKRTWPKTCT